jgi:hypothetical protein
MGTLHDGPPPHAGHHGEPLTLTEAEWLTVRGGKTIGTSDNPTTGQTFVTDRVFVDSGWLLVGSMALQD